MFPAPWVNKSNADFNFKHIIPSFANHTVEEGSLTIDLQRLQSAYVRFYVSVSSGWTKRFYQLLHTFLEGSGEFQVPKFFQSFQGKHHSPRVSFDFNLKPRRPVVAMVGRRLLCLKVWVISVCRYVVWVLGSNTSMAHGYPTISQAFTYQQPGEARADFLKSLLMSLVLLGLFRLFLDPIWPELMYFTQQSRFMTTRTHRKFWLLHALRVLNSPLSVLGGPNKNPEQTWHAPNRTTPTTHSLTLVSECSKRYTSNMAPQFFLRGAPSPNQTCLFSNVKSTTHKKTGQELWFLTRFYLFFKTIPLYNFRSIASGHMRFVSTSPTSARYPPWGTRSCWNIHHDPWCWWPQKTSVETVKIGGFLF